MTSPPPKTPDSVFEKMRKQMVEEQIAARGVKDTAVLAAMKRVPRHAFVTPGDEDRAYQDRPLPIGEGQTISQPYIVAAMTEALQLKGDEFVLEVGTGCGYAAAILGEVGAKVVTIERIGKLAELARQNLAKAGYNSVRVMCGDGSVGLAELAPFDAIVVTAGGPSVPQSLKHQLKTGGRLVIPVGRSSYDQRLLRITRTGEDNFAKDDLGSVRFVPLIGKEGWEKDDRLL